MQEIILPEQVAKLIKRTETAGFEARAVGGCVRDALLGRTPEDWDVTTSAGPEEIKKIFAGERIIATGEKFGSVTVIMDGLTIEVTTYRSDGNYTDHRRPDSVSFSKDIAEDLKRRDFTVNAMAYAPGEEIIDLFGGENDIKAKVLRCVGDAEKRFSEDALRIMRLYRFSGQLGFAVEESVRRAARELKKNLRDVSKERIYKEVLKLITSDGAGEALAMMNEDGVSDEVFGKRADEQSFPHLENLEKNVAVRFAAIFPEENDAKRVLMSLRAPSKVINEAEIFANIARNDISGGFGIKKLCAKYGDETVHGALLMRKVLKGEEKLIEEFFGITERGECRSLTGLCVSGNDIAPLLRDEKDTGKVLMTLLEGVMSGKTENTREALIKSAKTEFPALFTEKTKGASGS